MRSVVQSGEGTFQGFGRWPEWGCGYGFAGAASDGMFPLFILRTGFQLQGSWN
jgi:hypothetical protein